MAYVYLYLAALGGFLFGLFVMGPVAAGARADARDYDRERG